VALVELGDSLGVVIGSATKTQTILPDPRMTELAQRRDAPELRVEQVANPMIVDSSGVYGLFWAVDDAIEAGYTAGRSEISIAVGTYAPFTMDRGGMTVRGSGRSDHYPPVTPATVIRGTGSSAAITYTNNGYYCLLENLTAYTAPGGGGGGYEAINIVANTNETRINNISVAGSDDNCITLFGGANTITNVFLNLCDSNGIYIGNSPGDNNVIGGVHVPDNRGNYSINVAASAANNVIWGRIAGAVSGTAAFNGDNTYGAF